MTTGTAVLSVDIGTSSTKGVLVDLSGRVVAASGREHAVSRPRPGWAEMDAGIWWDEYQDLARELARRASELNLTVAALGVSGMGPCALITDLAGTPLRPALLYGIDTRAGEQIERLNRDLGEAEILARCGSALSSQATGPKLAWLAEHEPVIAAAPRRLFMPSSWLAYHLTGNYGLDYHSASQAVPLFDLDQHQWYEPWARHVAPWLELPPLAWPGEEAGRLTEQAARELGLRAGLPVITGSVDAWLEAISAGAHHDGDLMLMYGTTLFLIATSRRRLSAPGMWGTLGALPGSYSVAGGLATSGALTAWLAGLTGGDYETLTREAAESGPGARGLLMLPYFAGERTPLMDPDARGVIAGLTLSHTRGDLYRAALEATAFGVRHNLEAMAGSGAGIRRVVAVGGGTQGELWLQIVSDVTGCEQILPQQTIGASYGGALLAAALVADVDIAAWNPDRAVITPDPMLRERYADRYGQYRELYPSTRPVVHHLAREQRDEFPAE
jgi:xylulokinase